MPNYKKMYFELAGKVATAIDILVQAQQDGEDSYVNGGNTPPILLTNPFQDEETENG